jgi:hypothetical protein
VGCGSIIERYEARHKELGPWIREVRLQELHVGRHCAWVLGGSDQAWKAKGVNAG